MHDVPVGIALVSESLLHFEYRAQYRFHKYVDEYAFDPG